MRNSLIILFIVVLSVFVKAQDSSLSNTTGAVDYLLGRVDAYLSPLVLIPYTDTTAAVAMQWEVDGKLNKGDTTAVRTFSDLKYLENGDSTAQRTFSDLKYLVDADTGGFRTFSDLKYLENADSTNQRTFSDLKYLADPDTSGFRTFSDLKYLENVDSTNQRTFSDSKYQSKTIVTKSTATSYTIGTTDANEFYGGVIYVTGASTITIPAVVAGASFTVITIGNIAVSVDPNGSDLMYLDGTALADGDKATNTSTTGDMIVFTYYGATGWYAASDGWSDGN